MVTAEKGKQASRRLPIFAWAMALVVVPAVLYIGYVLNQIREVEKRDLRLLGTAVQRIEIVLGQAEKTVRSLENDFSFAHEFDKRQPYLEAHHEHAEEVGGLDRLRRWEQGLAVDGSLEVVGGCRQEIEKAGSQVGISTRFERHEDHLLLEAQVCEAERIQGADRGCKPHDEEANGEAETGAAGEAICTPLDEHFTFRVDLKAILAEISFGDAFDLLVLADETGQVRLESRPPSTDLGLRVSHLEPLLASVVGEPAEAARSGGLPRSSVQFDVRLVEEEFKMLCQPLELAGFHPDHEQEEAERTTAIWSLCGLVSADRKLRDALGVAPQLALAMLLFVIATLITWPFLKLLFMDRRERFRFVDAYLQLLSTFTLLLLAAILLFDLDSYRGLKKQIRGGMETLAQQVERHLLEELVCLRDQLVEFDRLAWVLDAEVVDDALKAAVDDQQPSHDSEPGGEARCEPRSTPRAANLLRPPGAAATADSPPGTCKPPVLMLPPPVHQLFTSVFWMDTNGMQVAKATVRGRNTPPVDRKDREYFRAIKERRTWSFEHYSGGERDKPGEPQCPLPDPRGVGRAWRPAAAADFYFQTYRSDTTGIRSAALSVPSQRTASTEWLVAAITVEPISMLHPVLPPGYDFAVIDADGKALFHSDPLQALEENVFPELEDADRLRAALRSRTKEHFDTTYQTRPSLAFVRPLEVMPWSIVVFYDHELLRTVNLEALLRAIFWAMIYLLLFNVPPALYLAFRGRQARWLWPEEEKADLYRGLTFGFGAMLLAFALLVAALEGAALLIASFGLPFVVGGWGWMSYGRWLRRRKATPEDSPETAPTQSLPSELDEEEDESTLRRFGRWTLSHFGSPMLRWHVAALTLYWLLVSVLPGLGFFKVAWSEQLEVMARLHGLELHEQLVERARRVEDELREIEVSNGFLERRLRHGVPAAAVQARAALAEAPGSSTVSRTPALDLYLLRRDEPVKAPLLRSEILPATKPGGPDSPLPLARQLARYLPLYNRSTQGLRYLGGASAADDSLLWWSGPLDPLPGESRRQARAIFVRPGESPLAPEVIATSLAGSGPWGGLALAVGGLGLLLLLVFWVRYAALNLFFARIGRQVELLTASELERRVLSAGTDPERADGCIIALIASPADRRDLGSSGKFHRVDMRLPDEETLARTMAEAAAASKPLLCERFESGLRDPEVRDRKLRLLEHLVLEKRKRQIVMPTTLNPFEDLFWFRRVLVDDRFAASSGEGEPGARQLGAIRLADDRAARWGQVLSPFMIQPVGHKPGEWRLPGHTRTYELHLPMERQEGLERLIEEREGHYWALWNACSADEQLVLVHLAEEGVANPKQRLIVRRLLQRGLVVRDPRLRLMEDDFALFVRRIHEPLEVARWERAVHGLGWKQLRWAFFSVLAIVALFLFATQQALFDATIGFISAVAVGVPGLLRMLTTLRRGAATPG